MPTPEDKRAIELLETVRKKRTALERRLKKVSYRAIADELGVSIGTVRMWVKEMTVTMLPQEEIEELRAQDAAGYDESEQRTLWMMELTAKDADALTAEGKPTDRQVELLAKLNDQLIHIRKQRAMLLGMNAPVKVEHKHTVRTEFDAEVESLVTDLLGGGKVLSQPDQVDVGDA
jgi:hypothetical protein